MTAAAATRGETLWSEIVELHELDAIQRTLLEEACRCADRLEELDTLIRARGASSSVDDKTLGEARQQQNVMKQLLVALRLPDVKGRRTQLRSARGAYNAGSQKISSLDQARAAKSG